MIAIVYSLTRDRMELINEKLMLESMKIDEPRGFSLDEKLSMINNKVKCLDVAINALTSYEALSFNEAINRVK